MLTGVIPFDPNFQSFSDTGWWLGRIIPYIMENKKCLKPPARHILTLSFLPKRTVRKSRDHTLNTWICLKKNPKNQGIPCRLSSGFPIGKITTSSANPQDLTFLLELAVGMIPS